MGNDEYDSAFRYDYSHLYYRICQLGEAITACYLGKDVNVLINDEESKKGVPKIVEASFPAERAKKYCARMEKYFDRVPRNNDELPRPRFAVILTVDFGEGAFERYVFDFCMYGREYLTEFCKKVCDRGMYYYRSRAMSQYRKIAGLEK